MNEILKVKVYQNKYKNKYSLPFFLCQKKKNDNKVVGGKIPLKVANQISW